MTTLKEIESLSVPERVQLVEDVWDSIARTNSSFPIPQWQKNELERRKQKHLRNPGVALPWDQVKQKILQST